MSPTPPNASQRQPELALLTAGNDTGWWDEHGRPAPWPEDYWLPDGSINPDWKNTSTEEEPEPAKPSENPNI